MKILSFPNQKEFGPLPWIRSDVASYATLYADVLNAFDNLGPLFDDLVGEGEKGVWQDVLDGLEKDPQGPQINLRKELVVHLGPRICILTDYQLPITTTSERVLFAIEVKDEAKVAAALEKMFKNDKEMRKKVFEDRAIWESVPEEKTEVPAVTLDLPGLQPDQPGKAPAPPGRANALLPNAAVTVAHGYLLIASHYDFLTKKVLTKISPRESLSTSVEYKIVQKTLAGFGAAEKAAQTFGRTDEQTQATYELIRQGKMPESETMLGRMLNTPCLALAGGEFLASRKSIPARCRPTTSSAASSDRPACRP